MNFFEWVNSKIKKMVWFDISCVKLSVAGFILAVAKLWPGLLSLDWYWYAIIGALAAVKPSILKLTDFAAITVPGTIYGVQARLAPSS